MKRRDVLAGAAVSTIFVTGCLSGADERSDGMHDDENEDENSSYERCTNGVVGVNNLPQPAHDEVVAAIEHGEYETEGDLVLAETIDIDGAFLAYPGKAISDVSDDDFYTAKVTNINGGTRLQLEENVPSAGSGKLRSEPFVDPYDLDDSYDVDYPDDVNDLDDVYDLDNVYDPDDLDDVEFNLRIEYLTEDEVLTNETFEIGETITFGGSDYRWGDYRAEISAEIDGERVSSEIEWTVNNYTVQPHIQVKFILADHYNSPMQKGELDVWKDLLYRHGDGFGSTCEWNEAGELTHGRNDAGEIVDSG